MKKYYLIILSLLISHFSIAQKSATEKDSTVKTRTLDEVIVTSSRLQISKQLLPQKSEIITARDVEMNPSMDVGDIIKKMSSLDVIQRPGVATYATIRGFRPPVEPGRINPEVSVLINGRPSGTQNLALFDPNSIERIEVLKGAAGAIYGSSMMGGLINIITKKQTGKISGQIYGGYSSFKTTDFGYSVGGNITDKLDFNFSGTFFDRNEDFRFGSGNVFRSMLGSDKVDLFPVGKPTVSEADTMFDGKRRNGTQMSYYVNTLRVGYQLHKNWRVDASVNAFNGRGIESSGDLRNLDAASGNANRFYKNGDIAIRGNVGKHAITLLGYVTNEENSTFNNFSGSTLAFIPTPNFQRSEGIVGWKGVQFQDAITVNNNLKFVVGVDYNEATSQTRLWNQANAAAGFKVTEGRPSTPFSYVKTFAPFAQAYITLFKEKLIINPSVRNDFIDFGIVETPLFDNLKPRKENNTFFSPSLGLQYNINNSLAVHGNVGRAFRFAQAFEIAGYFEEFITGNKVRITTGNNDLKNEQSLTWDLGVKFNNRQKGLGLDITYFRTNVENRVRQVSVPEQVGKTHTDGRIIDRYLTFTNADQAEINGLEIEASYDFGALNNYKNSFRIFANMTRIIKAEDITKGTDTTPDVVVRIRNVAPVNLSYGFDYDTKKAWSFRLSGRYIAKRYAQDFGNLNTALRGAFMEFPSYMTMDFVANYAIQKQHIISLRVSNLTDENYYETRGFNLAGRNIGLRYSYRF